MIIKYNDYIKESINNNEHDDILIIVDVQYSFNKFIPSGMTEKINNLAKDFKYVYQIWDSNNHIKAPSYKFNNEILKIEKKFGTSYLSDDLKTFMNKNENSVEGSIFKIKNKNEYLIRVNNNHKWFYINENLVKLFSKLKNKKVVFVGGADGECLTDVCVAAKAFSITCILNHELIYSAETSNKQKVHDINNNQ